jgi:hypothetical protein
MVLAKTHQLDFNIDFGLNSSSVDRYFGIGYSFRMCCNFGGGDW